MSRELEKAGTELLRATFSREKDLLSRLSRSRNFTVRQCHLLNTALTEPVVETFVAMAGAHRLAGWWSRPAES